MTKPTTPTKNRSRMVLDIGEWLLITTLISENPKQFQKRDQYGSDVYDITKLMNGCAKLVFEDSQTQRQYCVSLVSKFKEYVENGYSCMEFKPFEDQST